MLVLSRKQKESIVIDGNIEVKVLRIEKGKILLGIKAPDEVPVVRGELVKAKGGDSAVEGPES